MMNERVLVISYHYFPDPSIGARRPSQLVSRLVEEGVEVEVITKKLEKTQESERADSVGFGRIHALGELPGIIDSVWKVVKPLVRRSNSDIQEPENEKSSTPTSSSSNPGLAYRAKRFIISMQSLLSATKWWVFFSFLKILVLKLKGQHFDLVVSSSPPASAHLLARFAKFVFGAKWVMDVRDPVTNWSQVFPVCRAPIRVSIENFLERSYYKACDQVVVTSPSLIPEIEKKFGVASEKLSLIYNGFDEDLVEESLNFNGPLHIVFAGNLVVNRDPFPFLEAIGELIGSGVVRKDGIKFTLYGDCNYWNGLDVVEFLRKNELDEVVELAGFISRDQLLDKLKDAHVLVNFAQNQLSQIPAKTFEYMVYPGLMLVISEDVSDTSNLVRQSGLGLVVDSNKGQIVETLSEISEMFLRQNMNIEPDQAKTNEMKLEYSRKEQNKRYIDLLKNVADAK